MLRYLSTAAFGVLLTNQENGPEGGRSGRPSRGEKIRLLGNWCSPNSILTRSDGSGFNAVSPL